MNTCHTFAHLFTFSSPKILDKCRNLCILQRSEVNTLSGEVSQFQQLFWSQEDEIDSAISSKDSTNMTSTDLYPIWMCTKPH